MDKKNACHLSVKLHSIDKIYERVTTESMKKGLLFEWLALGNPAKDGTITDSLPKLKNGSDSVDEQRIRQQAEMFKKLIEEYRIHIISKRTILSYDYSEDVVLTAELDAIGLQLRDNGIQLIVIDTKLTSNINNNYGDYPWGNPESMDHIQALFYPYIVNKAFKEVELDTYPEFWYMIFDYKPLMDYVIYNYKQTELRKKEVVERINKTISDIRYYESTEWPINPSSENCSKCGYLSQCKFGVNLKPIKEI